MNRTIYHATPILMLVLSLVGTLAGAQTPRTAASERNERAMSSLKRMADFLSQAQRFSVMVDIGFDVVQDSGQKIEFGETREIVVRRPAHARVDSTKRDGGTSGFISPGAGWPPRYRGRVSRTRWCAISAVLTAPLRPARSSQ
jgi:hypothetical protein